MVILQFTQNKTGNSPRLPPLEIDFNTEKCAMQMKKHTVGFTGQIRVNKNMHVYDGTKLKLHTN